MSAAGTATTSGMAANAGTARRWEAAGNTEWAGITKITGMVAKATTRVTTFPVRPDARGILPANMAADMAAQALMAAVPVVTTSVALGGAGKSVAGGNAPRTWCPHGSVTKRQSAAGAWTSSARNIGGADRGATDVRMI